MATTTQLVDRLCDRMATSTSSPAHFSRLMVVDWLDEAQKLLCVTGPIHKTAFQGTGQANVEITQLPIPDIHKICAVYINRSGGVKKKLTPMGHIGERPADRSTQTQDVPSKYAVWAGNDASGNSVRGLIFDKNFGQTWASPDLVIFIRQIPKTLDESPTQDPEIPLMWHDALLDYAEMRARMRLSIMDPAQKDMAMIASGMWNAALKRAEDAAEPESEDQPITINDAMGYTIDDEDFNIG